ncbi:MAG: EthD domain-containing protein [Myxococcota bacterium]|nr:EthD domain-containing protein [Myxococcota bacterium]
MKSLLLLHFRARPGRAAELLGLLPEWAREWCGRLHGQSFEATVMSAHEEDLFRRAGDGSAAPGFDASLEIELEDSDAGASFEALSDEAGSRFEAFVQPELSVAQVGVRKAFRPCEPTAIRYQYCMKRRDDFTPDAYLRYYGEEHSKFGLMMEGVQGYSQIHLDPEATASAIRLSGFSFRHFDSVSILHLASVEELIEAGRSNAVSGFAEDEEKFVDRAQSIMWISDEVFRLKA